MPYFHLKMTSCVIVAVSLNLPSSPWKQIGQGWVTWDGDEGDPDWRAGRDCVTQRAGPAPLGGRSAVHDILKTDTLRGISWSWNNRWGRQRLGRLALQGEYLSLPPSPSINELAALFYFKLSRSTSLEHPATCLFRLLFAFHGAVCGLLTKNKKAGKPK